LLHCDREPRLYCGKNIQGVVTIDEQSFQADLRRGPALTHRARAVLGVGDDASLDDVKRAWRKACLETHPDRNPGDPDASRRFCLVHCAYHCLTEGRLCEEMLNDMKDSASAPPGKYNLANPWGYYLNWRERFFE